MGTPTSSKGVVAVLGLAVPSPEEREEVLSKNIKPGTRYWMSVRGGEFLTFDRTEITKIKGDREVNALRVCGSNSGVPCYHPPDDKFWVRKQNSE